MKLILEGGTDVAQVALFCREDLPDSTPNDESVSAMEQRDTLIRLSTGADGAYLLHLYVDEPIEEHVFRFCVQDDSLSGRFTTKNGKVGFGGLESTSSQFTPNNNIRADGEIAQGSYQYTAYHTEYPDEHIEGAVIDAIGNEGMRYLNRPTLILWPTLLAVAILLVLTISRSLLFAIPAILVAMAGGLLYIRYVRSAKYLQLQQQKREVERNYPGIVIRLESMTT
jgi:hypothetical protein